MHPRQLDVLTVVRIFGPITKRGITRRMPLDWDDTRTRAIVKSLVNTGYLVKQAGGRYDVTNLGRAAFSSHASKR